MRGNLQLRLTLTAADQSDEPKCISLGGGVVPNSYHFLLCVSKTGCDSFLSCYVMAFGTASGQG